MNDTDMKRLFCTVLLGFTAMESAAVPTMPPQTAEVSDVATLPPSTAHWLFTGGEHQWSYVIFDGDSGAMEGSVPAGHDPHFAITPDNGHFYVSETYWSHGNRGNYIMHPAASVVWVDLKKQAIGGTVEIPGCALIFPWGDDGFSSSCGDGSIASVTVPETGPAKVTHTKPFFDANSDPIYENSFVDRATGNAVFLSYTGLVYAATLGANTVVAKPWSIQRAAGFAAAGTGVQQLAWRPGGSQLAAYHKASGRLFVLMHMGNYWTHNQGGTEVWVLDTKTHALLSRYPLQPVPTSGLGNERVPFYKSMGVSQDARPLLYLLNEEGNDVVLDAATGAPLRTIEFAAGDTIAVPGY